MARWSGFFVLVAIMVASSLLLCTTTLASIADESWDGKIVMPTEQAGAEKEDVKEQGQRWAILVAGSSGYGNYRHQVGPNTLMLQECEFRYQKGCCS
jgi:hypothetical protein